MLRRRILQRKRKFRRPLSSMCAVSTVSTVSSEQWAASPTLETECSANFYISEYFTNYLFNIRDISRYLIDTKYEKNSIDMLWLQKNIFKKS